jgi:hypothetical protein
MITDLEKPIVRQDNLQTMHASVLVKIVDERPSHNFSDFLNIECFAHNYARRPDKPAAHESSLRILDTPL